MPYGILKCDTVTFTNAGVDKSVSISGLVQNPTFSGNVTVTGTISGVTVTGTTASFTSGNFTNISGGTHTITSGVFAAGSAANPSISFTSDPNTGIYSPGADQVAISTNGTGRLFVDSSGNVGAGSASLSSLFRVTVNGNGSSIVGGLSLRNNGTEYLTIGNANVSSATDVDIWHTQNGYLRFATNNQECLRITSDGKVGLGTSSPGAKLDVWPASSEAAFRGNSGVSVQVPAFELRGYNTNTTNGGLDIRTYLNGAFGDRVRITNDGLVGVGTSAPGSSLHVNSGATGTVAKLESTGTGSYLNFVNSSGSSVYVGAIATSFFVETNGSERARIDSSGRLLVGTSTASGNNFLQIQGDSGGATGTGGISLRRNVAPSGMGEGAFEGIIDFGPNDGGVGARIAAVADAQQGTNDYPSRLVFSTTADGASSPTERMRIDSSGRVGVGTTSVSSIFHIQQPADNNGITLSHVSRAGIWKIYHSGVSSQNLAFFQNNGTSDALSYLMGRDSHEWYTGGTAKAAIDSSGRLLVGTSSARSNLFNGTVSSQFQVEGTATTGRIISLISSSTSGGEPPFIVLGKQNSGTVGGNTVVASGDNVGIISFQGNDGTEFVEAARVSCEVDGTPGANDMPGRLVFSTTADGASSPTERMRISNTGEVLIGTTASTAGAGGVAIQTNLADGANVFPRLSFNSSSTSADLVSFKYSGTQVGRINVTNTATSYVTSSDYRLKENVEPVADGIVRLNQLKPSRFNYIVDPDTTVDGFIAHEVQAVVPEAITGEKDAVDADGNPIYQGIDQSKLVPLLTAALQEAVAKIESLAARLTAAGI